MFKQVKEDVDAENEAYIYYNALMTNTYSYLDPIQANYTDLSTQPIINHMEKYKLAIVRFNVPIPRFLFNYTDNMTVVFSYGGNDYNEFLVYEPWSFDAASLDPVGTYVTTYQQFCNMINTAMNAAFTACKLANPSLTQVVPPKVAFNVNTQKFEIFGTKEWVDGSVKPALYWNDELYNRIPNIPAKYYGSQYEIILANIGNNTNNTTTIKNIGNYVNTSGNTIYNYNTSGTWVVSQQSQNLGALFDCQGIQLITTMPIKSESIPLSSSSQGQASANYKRILTDYTINYDVGLESQPYFGGSFHYVLQNTNTRKISFIGQGILNQIDFQVYWYDKVGNIYPLTIDYQQTMSVKFQFSKKKKVN